MEHVRGRAAMGRASEGRCLVQLRRRLGLTRNPMYRTSDRLEALLLLAVVVVTILAIPLAVGNARDAYREGIQHAEKLSADGHWGKAILLEEPSTAAVATPDAPTEYPTFALARWRGPDGEWRKGRVPVDSDSEAGAVVRVWFDKSGTVGRPPPTKGEVSDQAVATGLTTWLSTELAVIVGYLLLRWWLDRRRLASWEAEWEQVAPRWTRKLR